ncbi:protein of unknown function (plasmid) [Cupriavidus neocaledonicus]|uniref:Uncharacterized protein n=1 Tax=Cupriavidus neocaledonicus TaxID=1040979 RepID=A0A375HUA5_9BURK|nr:protein of unknown function [Cupriavidus neocaledonicus]
MLLPSPPPLSRKRERGENQREAKSFGFARDTAAPDKHDHRPQFQRIPNTHTVATGVTGDPTAPGNLNGGAVN